MTYIYDSDVRVLLLSSCDQQREKGLCECERAQVAESDLSAGLADSVKETYFVVMISCTPSGMILYGSIMLHPGQYTVHGLSREENVRSCIIHQDVQPLLLLQELLCGRPGKFRCRQVKLQKLDLTVSWGEASSFDALNGIQPLLPIPRSEVNFSAIAGQSLDGL